MRLVQVIRIKLIGVLVASNIGLTEKAQLSHPLTLMVMVDSLTKQVLHRILETLEKPHLGLLYLVRQPGPPIPSKTVSWLKSIKASAPKLQGYSELPKFMRFHIRANNSGMLYKDSLS